METAMDVEIMQAQERLLKKRESLGVTTTHTLSMLNVDSVMPRELSLRCEIHDIEMPDPGDECWKCNEERRDRERKEEAMAKIYSIIENPSRELISHGVPPKYAGCSFENFKGNDKAVSECRGYTDGGLVLYGNTGCGKTHLAAAIARERLIRRLNDILGKDDLGKMTYTYGRMIFVTVPDLLLDIRESFKSEAKESEAEIIDTYSSVQFLVLDDLGSEKTSEYAITTLYIILDRRDREMKSTVITTNLSLKEIEDKLNARISSRMAGMKNIKINMPDYRKRRG